MKDAPEIPASPVLRMLVEHIQARANEQIGAALEAERRHLGLPPEAKVDLQRGVWMLRPLVPEAAPGAAPE